ncbi:MAG: His-Xaa-Ser system protein HxsD [Elusimicrobiota bacterium]
MNAPVKRGNAMAARRPKVSTIKVDLAVYPLEAVQAAAYSMTPHLSVRIQRSGRGFVAVVLKPKAGGDLEAFADEFHNELLHESLRLQVSKANQKIREYIVTKALVSAQVPSVAPPAAPASRSGEDSLRERPAQQASAVPPPIDAELDKEIEKLLAEIEKGDGADDPLGVAVPWEEKYGGKAGGDAAPSKGTKAAPRPEAAKPGTA